MTVSPDGPLSLPLQAARELLAASTEFRTWTGTATEAAALDRVWVLQTPDFDPRSTDRETVSPSPLAIVDYSSFVREREVLKAARFGEPATGCEISIYFRALSTGDDNDAAWNFLNSIGAIMEDLELNAAGEEGSMLAIVRTELAIGPQRVEKQLRDSHGDYWETVITITFTRQPSKF